MAAVALTILRGEQTLSGAVWLDRVGKKLSVKADLFIYSNCVTMSG